MPAAKYYKITQTREVEVMASTETQAAVYATRAFNGEAAAEPGISITKRPQVTGLNIELDRTRG